MLGKRKLKKITAPSTRAVPQRLGIPYGVLFRMFAIGSVAILACVYALWRYYTVPYRPMLVPAPPAPSASEIEVEVPPEYLEQGKP